MANFHDDINIFSDYLLEVNDITLIEPCFCITLFSKEVVTNEYAPERLLTPYRIFCEDFASQVDQIIFDGNQKNGVKINDKNKKIPFEWLSNSKKRVKGGSVTYLFSGNNKMERRLPFLQWYYDNKDVDIEQPSHCYYRILLPLSWLSMQRVKDIELYVNRIIGDFPLFYGYAGFAINFHSGAINADTEVYIKNWLERFPGIMSPDPYTESKTSSKKNGITSIGWITVLGKALSERLGGGKAIREVMSVFPDVNVVSSVQENTMIRIGETPLLGDSLSGNHLDNYCLVGRKLLPLHIEELTSWEERFGYYYVTGIKNTADRKKWFNRFFDSKEGN